MPIEQDIRHYVHQLTQAPRRPLTRQGLTRLQELTVHLGDILSQAEAALRGRVDLTGALWPERDEEDDKMPNPGERMTRYRAWQAEQQRS